MSWHERHPNGLLTSIYSAALDLSLDTELHFRATIINVTTPALPHAFDANAQNHLSFTTTFAFVKPAAMSSSGNPLFGCPNKS